jgi:hypothetical protein
MVIRFFAAKTTKLKLVLRKHKPKKGNTMQLAELKANEYIEMPILFYIDPEFLKDPKMKDIESITLSYTFFRSDFKL